MNDDSQARDAGSAAVPPPIFIEAQDLAFAHPGQATPLLGPLSFTIKPGLSLLRGGDGRGKTSLLRLIAGRLTPSTGALHRQAALSLCFESPEEAEHDPVNARVWLSERQARFPHWQPALAAELVAGFALTEHLDKPLYMLSTGSRRKLGLVAAAASAAQLTLLDMPFAALDGSSRRLLSQLLAREAANSSRRAWVIADHELPASLAGLPWSAQVDLGD